VLQRNLQLGPAACAAGCQLANRAKQLHHRELAWNCTRWLIDKLAPSVRQVPIMLRSNYCSLNDRSDKDLTEVGECPFDQVRCA